MKAKLLLLPALTALSLSANAASYLTGGHIDGPAFGYDSLTGFEPHYHNEGGADGAVVDGVVQTTESEYEPDELIVVVPYNSTITVSSTNYYWLPETETAAANNGAPFLGVGLEELDPLDWVGGTVTLTLLSISGPGDFLLWQDGGLGGPDVFLDSANNTLSFDLAAGTHTHFNWGFTELGFYNLEFQISGEHLTDGPQSGAATYTFMVPEPTTALLGAFGAIGLLRRRRA